MSQRMGNISVCNGESVSQIIGDSSEDFDDTMSMLKFRNFGEERRFSQLMERGVTISAHNNQGSQVQIMNAKKLPSKFIESGYILVTSGEIAVVCINGSVKFLSTVKSNNKITVVVESNSKNSTSCICPVCKISKQSVYCLHPCYHVACFKCAWKDRKPTEVKTECPVCCKRVTKMIELQY